MPAAHRPDCFCVACVPGLLRLLDARAADPLAPTTLLIRTRRPTRVLSARGVETGGGR